MANNRIYLKCEACGKMLFLGKRGQTGYHYENYDGVSLEDKLNKFYREHTFCGGKLGFDENPDSSLDNYEIEYEFDDKGKHGHCIIKDDSDVSPVRHAVWKRIKLPPAGYDLYGYQCSGCGYVDEVQHSVAVSRKGYKYCPYCGAKMDGAKEANHESCDFVPWQAHE